MSCAGARGARGRRQRAAQRRRRAAKGGAGRHGGGMSGSEVFRSEPWRLLSLRSWPAEVERGAIGDRVCAKRQRQAQAQEEVVCAARRNKLCPTDAVSNSCRWPIFQGFCYRTRDIVAMLNRVRQNGAKTLGYVQGSDVETSPACGITLSIGYHCLGCPADHCIGCLCWCSLEA